MNKNLKKKSIFMLLFVAVFITFYFSYSLLIGRSADSQDRIHFLGVAADATVIESNGHFGLVDALNPTNVGSKEFASNGTVVKDYLTNLGCTHLDFVIVTHSHYDHNGGIPELGNLVDENTIVFMKEDLVSYKNGVSDDVEDSVKNWNNHGYYELALNYFNSKNAKICDVSKADQLNNSSCNLSTLTNSYISGVNFGENNNFYYDSNVRKNLYFDFGDFRINLYNIYNLAYHRENLNSIVTTVTHKNGGAKAALLADIETAISDSDLSENAGRANLINNPTGDCDECTTLGIENQVSDVIGKVNLVKAAHHGSATSNSYYALSNYQPDFYITTSTHQVHNDKPYPLASNTAATIYLNKTFSAESFYTTEASGAIVAQFSDNSTQLEIYDYDFDGNNTNAELEAMGSYYPNGWFKMNNLTSKDFKYVYVENNSVVTGWKKINDLWYHLNLDTAVMDEGFFTDTDDNIYYLCDDTECTQGSMQKGFQTFEDDIFYFRKSKDEISEGPMGSMVTGFATLDNNLYYFRKDMDDISSGPMGSAIKDECVIIESNSYCFDKNGRYTSSKTTMPVPTTNLCLNPIYNGEEQDLVSSSAAYALTNNKKINAGDYDVTFTLNENYIWSDNTETPKTITCSLYKSKHDAPSVTNYEGIYDGLEHFITLLNPHNFEVAYSTDGENYSSTIPSRIISGITEVYVKFLADQNHLESDQTKGTITINKKSPTITYTDTKESDSLNKNIKYTSLSTDVSGTFIISSSNANVLTIDDYNFHLNANEVKDVMIHTYSEGTSEITIIFNPDDTTNHESYMSTKSFNVTPIKVAIPTSTYCKSNLVYNGESQIITSEPSEGYTFLNNIQINAGTYVVSAKLKAGYTWVDESTNDKAFDCKVNKAEPKDFTVTSYNGVYDKVDHTVTVSNVDWGTIMYGDTSVTPVEYQTQAISRVDAGTTNMYIFVKGDINHKDSTIKQAYIKIDKAIPETNFELVDTSSINVGSYREFAKMSSIVKGTFRFTLDDALIDNYPSEISASANENVVFTARGLHTGETTLHVTFIPDDDNYQNAQFDFDLNVVNNTSDKMDIPTSNTSCKTNLIYNGEEQTITNEDAIGYQFINNKGTNAGNYTVTAKLKEGYKWVDDTLTDKTVICSIAKADLVIPTILNYTGDYDGESHTVNVNEVDGATVKYSLDGNEYSLEKPTRTNAGTTTFYIKYFGDSNHNDSSTYNAKIVINKVNPVISDTTINPSIPEGENKQFVKIKSNVAGIFTFSSSDQTIFTVNALPVSVGEGETTTVYVDTIKKGTADLNVLFTPTNENYNSINTSYTLTVTEPEKIKVNIPTSDTHCKSNLKYTGADLVITKNPDDGYTFSNNVHKDAGTYVVSAKLNDGFMWSDNTIADKTFSCVILPEDKYVNFDNDHLDVAGGYIKPKTSGIISYATLKGYINTNGTINTSKQDADSVATCDEIIIDLGDVTYSYKMIIKGDITKKGSVNISDVNMLFNYLRRINTLSECQLKAANVTSDNDIHINDVAKLYQFVHNKIEGLDD